MNDMRRRQPNSVEDLLQEAYLNTEEQEEVVRGLKQQQAKQSQQWTAVFAVLALVLGLGCLYLSWHQLTDPWGLRHHAFFSGAFSSSLVSLAEACSGISLLLTAAALQTADATLDSNKRAHESQRLPHILLLTSASSAVLTGVLWVFLIVTAAHFQDEPLLHTLRYAWLPCTPTAYVLLTYYLLSSFRGTERQIASLRNSMYSLHTA